jgi:propionyl-CoA carboxylase alpha chain
MCFVIRRFSTAPPTRHFRHAGLAELSARWPTAPRKLSAIAAALADAAHNRATAEVFASIPSGWRNLASGFQVKSYRDDADNEHRVEYRFTRNGLVFAEDEPVRLVSAMQDKVVLSDGAGVACSFAVARYDQDIHVDSARGPFI